MYKKVKVVLVISLLIMGIYLLSNHLKDDVKEIEKLFLSFHQPTPDIIHVEFLDNNHAIAFFETGPINELYFGSAVFKKGLFNWKYRGSLSGQTPKDYKLDFGFSNLAQRDFSDYTDLFRGKILDSKIDKVTIVTEAGNEYEAKVIEYNEGDRFWFLVTKGESLLGSTITGLSSDGEIIEQTTR